MHLDALYHTALRLSQSRADAEDIVQDTMVRAFRSFHRFNPGTNCRAWLFTILRNVFLSRLRRSGREIVEADPTALEPLPNTDGLPAAAPTSPEDALFQAVLHGDVERALRTLPLWFREAVVLVDLEGLSYREAAEVMGCPVGTVMSRLSRGRQLLRRALERFAREHGYLRDER